MGTTEDNLGKFGFGSTRADFDLGYVVDDISVSAIPEPATLGMVGLVSGAMLFIRRRLMI